MDCAEELAKLLYYRAQELKEAHKQMDIAYVINDILMKRSAVDCMNRKWIRECLARVIYQIENSDKSPEVSNPS